MKHVLVVGVGGTWSWQGGWWQVDSPFWTFMRAHGFAPALPRRNPHPFEWETGLGDSLKFWRSGEARIRYWRYGGRHLSYYLDDLEYRDRNVIAHSHGGQLALFEAAEGLAIHRLLTIATPVRADMDAVALKAADNIGRWHHVCDRDSDRIGFWGAFGDGKIGNARTHPRAHQNILIPKIAHSRLLSDPAAFQHWIDDGLIDFLRSEDPPGSVGTGAVPPAT